MQVKQYWFFAKQTFRAFEQRADQWILRNPVALWRHFRFRSQQKTQFSPRHRYAKTLLKFFLMGYLIPNLTQIQLNLYKWSIVRRYMTEYQILSNIAEHDQLQQVGQQRHLRSLFHKGKKQGLSQVELFELSKLLELNYTA